MVKTNFKKTMACTGSNAMRWIALILLLGCMASPLLVAQATTSTTFTGLGPISGVINPATGKIYAPNTNSTTPSTISVVSTDLSQTYSGVYPPLSKNINLPCNNCHPQGAAVNPVTNKIYVPLLVAGTVAIIDGNTDTLIGSPITVGTQPYAVAVNTNTNQVYITNSVDGTVSVIDGNTNLVTDTIAVGAAPYALAVNAATNKVYVANYNSSSVTVIDAGNGNATSTISSVAVPYAISVNPVTNKLYAVNYNSGSSTPGTITVIDGVTNTVSGTVTVGIEPRGLALNYLTNKIYVANYGNASSSSTSGSLSVVDGNTNTVTATVPNWAGSGPYSVAVNVVTNKIYAWDGGGNLIMLDGVTNATRNLTNSYIGAFGCQDIVINQIANRTYCLSGGYAMGIDGATNDASTTSLGTSGGGPIGAVANPVTNKTYVLSGAGSNTVSVVDGTTGAVTPAFQIGSDLKAIAVNNVKNLIYVTDAGGGGQMYVVDGTEGAGYPIIATVPVGEYPNFVVVNPASVNPITGAPNHMIYVVNQPPAPAQGSVTVVNGLTNTVLINPATGTSSPYTIPVGVNPSGIAVNQATERIYVTNQDDNTLTLIDGLYNRSLATIGTGTKPVAVVANPLTNMYYVLNNGDKNVWQFRGTDNQHMTAQPSTTVNPVAMALDPKSNRLYVVDSGSNYLYDMIFDNSTFNYPGSYTMLLSSNGCAAPNVVAVNTVTNKIYAASTTTNNICVVDGIGHVVVATIPAGNGPRLAVANPVTGKTYVANNDQTVTSITESNTVDQLLDTSIAADTTDPYIVPPTPVLVTYNPSPKINFTATTRYVPGSLPPNYLSYQIDTWQGLWQPATLDSTDGTTTAFSANILANARQADGTPYTKPITAGEHILFAFASDATSKSAGTYDDAERVGNTQAYYFDVLPIVTATTVVTDYPLPTGAQQGTTVTFTASIVDVIGNAVTVGTVQFYDGSTALGSPVAVDGTGHATYPTATTSWTLGSHTITATYIPASNYLPSSGTTTQRIYLTTTVSLTSDVNPSTYGQSVTFTATVNPTTATGTIAFTFNGVTISGCGTQTVTSGVATCTTSTLPVGTDPITAVYSGDSNYNSATSSAYNQVVTAGSSTIALVVNPSSVMYGDTSVMTATVTAGATGTVSFYANGTTFLGTATVDTVTGMAALDENTLLVGTYQITATYNGDVNYSPMTSTPQPLTVTQRTGVNGLTVIVSDVTRASGASNPATWNYAVTGQLVNGDTYVNAVTGTATFDTVYSGATTGAYPIHINGGLTATSYALTFVDGTLTITPVADVVSTAMTLTASTNNATYGTVVTFTATLDKTAATGTVSFYDGATYLGEGTVTNGVATLATMALPAGTHSVTAVYSGDGTYMSTSAGPVSVTITPLPLTVTVQDAWRAAGAADPAFSYVVAGTLVNGDTYESVINGVAAYTPSPATTAGATAGATFPINVSGLTSTNYMLTVVPGTLHILAATAATSTMQLTVDNATPTYGDPITLTAVVTPSAGSVDGDPVLFYCGTTYIGTGALSGMTATLPNVMLPAGTCVATAVFPGDANTAGSTSNPVVIMVAKAPLTMTIADASRAYGAGNPAFALDLSTVVGLVNSDTFATAVQGISIYTTTATAVSSAGTYPITYVGGLSSANYALTVNNGTLTVTQSQTNTLTLTSSLNPSTYGDSVTFTATLNPLSATGTVAFTSDGLSINCDAMAVTNGVATCTTSSLPAGTHVIEASYSGDMSNHAVTGTLSQVVNKATPGQNGVASVAVTSDINPSTYGQTVTFTVTVPNDATGTTTLSYNGSTIAGCVNLTILSGKATCTTSSLPVGTDQITATYSGNTNYNSAISAAYNQVVTAATPSITLVVNPSTVMYGDQSAFTAQLSVTGATGTVSFYEGSALLGVASLGANGAAVLLESTLPVGVHTVVATYNGDPNYASITSNSATLTVTKRTAPDGSAALVITVNNAQRPYQSPNPTFSYTISGALVNGDTYLTAISGTAVYSTTATLTSSAGHYPISILSGLYSNNYTLGFVNGTLTITKLPSTTIVTPSENTINQGNSVIFTATVAPTSATGTVTFYNGATPIAECTAVPVVNGVALCATTSLPTGTNSVTAQYSGDTNYTGSSAAATVVVNAPTVTADFAVALTPPSKYVAPGTSVNYTVTVTSVNGVFNNPVALTLTMNGVPLAQAMPRATYTLVPGTVTPGASGATSTLTITISQQTAHNAVPMDLGTKAPLVLAILLLPLATWRRARGKLLLCMVAMLLATSMLTGCSPGGYFGVTNRSYTILVTGTSGALSHNSNTATMTVE